MLFEVIKKVTINIQRFYIISRRRRKRKRNKIVSFHKKNAFFKIDFSLPARCNSANMNYIP